MRRNTGIWLGGVGFWAVAASLAWTVPIELDVSAQMLGGAADPAARPTLVTVEPGPTMLAAIGLLCLLLALRLRRRFRHEDSTSRIEVTRTHVQPVSLHTRASKPPGSPRL